MDQKNDEAKTAFTFDEDEDIQALLDEAAEAGSIAVDEQHGTADTSIFTDGIPQQTTPPKEPVPVPVETTAVDPDPFTFEDSVDPFQGFEDTIAPLEEPATPPAAVVSEVTPDAVLDEIKELQKTTDAVTSEVTEAEQVRHARSILRAAAKYRALEPNIRNVVAQLICQEKEFSEDEAVIAIRALNTDDETFATMASLREAKELDPVERAFHILSLPLEVRKSLGNLVAAFLGDQDNWVFEDSLNFTKKLVSAIDGLSPDAVSYVVAAEEVLRAAKQAQ